MDRETREPKRLRDGKAFHKKVQADWAAHAEGNVEVEKAAGVAQSASSTTPAN